MDRESVTGIVDLNFFQGAEGSGEYASDVGLLCVLSVEM